MPCLETHPSVVCTVLDDGGVLLHLETKFYYSLNPTGLAIWLCLEDRAGDPREALAARFPDAAGVFEAIDEFVADLGREKLVSPNGAAPAASASAGVPTASAAIPAAIAGLSSWQEPVLTRHAVPLSQILSNPFDPCVPLAE